MSAALIPVAPMRTARIIAMYACLLTGNALAWLWAFAVCRGHPVLLGMAVLAYVLGLRHAVDADHIAAIDNVTRRFVQRERDASGVGLHFSLGHSAVVVLACLFTARASTALQSHFSLLKDLGESFGTTVSATFLFVVAIANARTLYGVYTSFRARRSSADDSVVPLGFLGRLLRPVILLIARPWQMFPLGFLFGLGFDTATEISVLGLSANQAAQGLSLWSIMVFPALFTAAMSLVDTTDGIVMIKVYAWAAGKAERRVAYNLAVTFISVAVAVCVGALQVLHLVADQHAPKNQFWLWVMEANRNFSTLGCFIVALFIACWTMSIAASRRAVRGNAPREAEESD